ncbi:MAG TPA: thioredoxin domain-containing protein [Acidimicrobiales bacterium]|nr:thioredoxin domain-containing protein [Acidimicrobiales bacterium]
MPQNRLAGETSPYLRQHADNPVDWYPWGPEALAKAAAEDKPIFLSIGYASCHWCHVMAHESFEDDDTAAALSRWFVSVKVDREERPDIDTLYMAATQALTGSGGWPMSVFCTPDGRPFYAGTYFPPEDRHGMPAFRRVLEALGTAWTTERDAVLAQADSLSEAVRREMRLAESLAVSPDAADSPSAAATLDADGLIAAVATGLAAGFDPDWGGFGPPPKFPRPTLVELCLRHHGRTGSERSRQMALTTLDAMAAGGMYDHIVGGFCRYSTDGRWLVPHFEKMLTDQALLARAYIHAWLATGKSDYRTVAIETLDFVLRDLATPEGALYSSFDADAGGIEGGHATFTPGELAGILPSPLVAPAARWYGITDEGNWEHRSIPCRPVGAPLQRPAEVEEARRLLAEARSQRVQPARDEKVLTEWNAMAACALADAAAAMDRAHYGRRAEEIVRFLLSEMYVGGRLMRSWQGGTARHLALAADHAWLADACVRLSELTGRREWREQARRVAEDLVDLFYDEESGGFFTTGHDAEVLLERPKEFIDGAIPSANAIAVTALLRVGALGDSPRFARAVDRTVALARPLLERHPGALADLVSALPMVEGRQEIVVTGQRPDLVAEARRHWLPSAVLAWGEPDGSPLFAARPDGAAFVCRAFACQAPVDNDEALAAQLEGLVA